VSETAGEEGAYGCIFCVTGMELAAVQHIQRVCDDVHVIVARQFQQRTIHGKSHVAESLLFPGYAFFEASAREDVINRFPKHESILSILKTADGDWRLYGDDAKLVKWLFSYDGLLPLSQACKEGDWVRIIDGPLLDMQGKIVHFDKRHKSAQVAITFCNREIKTWFQFELVEKI